MRCIMVLALAGAVACAAPRTPATAVTLDGRVWDTSSLERAWPIAAGQSIRADEIGRTAGGSVHFVQVRAGETPHRHERHDLVVTLLGGRGRLTLEGAERTMRAGDVAVVPRGAVHWFVNEDEGARPAVALVIFMPPLDAPDTVPVGPVDRAPNAR